MLVDQAILASLIDMVDGATAEDTEGRVIVPAIVSPVAPIFRPLIRPGGTADTMRVSAVRDIDSTQSASDAGGTTDILRIGPGLWSIHVSHEFICDFTQAIVGLSPHSRVQYSTPDGLGNIFSAIFAITAAAYRTHDFWIPVRIRPTDSQLYVQFTLLEAATGVGETTRTHVIVQANKLL